MDLIDGLEDIEDIDDGKMLQASFRKKNVAGDGDGSIACARDSLDSDGKRLGRWGGGTVVMLNHGLVRGVTEKTLVAVGGGNLQGRIGRGGEVLTGRVGLREDDGGGAAIGVCGSGFLKKAGNRERAGVIGVHGVLGHGGGRGDRVVTEGNFRIGTADDSVYADADEGGRVDTVVTANGGGCACLEGGAPLGVLERGVGEDSIGYAAVGCGGEVDYSGRGV